MKKSLAKRICMVLVFMNIIIAGLCVMTNNFEHFEEVLEMPFISSSFVRALNGEYEIINE